MNKQLTKTELLLIRACKSKNDMKRLVSVYKKQYGVDGRDKSALLTILGGVIENHHPISASKLMKELNPNRSVFWGDGSYEDRALLILVSHLRLAEISIFNGWVSPAPFRNKLKLVSS